MYIIRIFFNIFKVEKVSENFTTTLKFLKCTFYICCRYAHIRINFFYYVTILKKLVLFYDNITG